MNSFAPRSRVSYLAWMRALLVCSLLGLATYAGWLSAADKPTAPAPLPPARFYESTVDAPLPAIEAARSMVVPEGFQVSLFAAEPDVQQPVGFCLDDRARLWVVEAYSYPQHTRQGNDRIVILEDTDNDGRSDKRTVFYDKLNYVTGIEVGFGGAWVMSPPYFYFIPDKDGDDRPDGPPQVLLDGFGLHANAHNLANGFAWGPDGWLYGTHGRTNWSMLAKPGTPDEQRVRFDGGVYRYHPTRHVWEPYCDGTTNPWGIDWNDWGEAFVSNCVNPHLFHVIYGAHYEPWRNRESSQYSYERIDTIADHLHFVGGNNVRGGLGSAAEDAAGGGHAHCGTLVYLGDSWPESYRNTLFTNNIHGRRINNDLLRRHGSGYTAAHGPDLMRSRDPWYMGVTLRYGPDGSVFASDWSDTGECHSTKNTRRETGRIYKISYGPRRAPSKDVAQLSTRELVDLQTHRNDWFVQHARRLLQERVATGQDMTEAIKQLRSMYARETDIPRKLRSLWALQAMGQVDDEFLVAQLSHEHESIRAWAVRLLCEDNAPPPIALAKFAELARHDPSSYVRLHLASMLQRLASADRWLIAAALLTHEEDAGDHNLPLMIWYGIEPLVNSDLERFVTLAQTGKLPKVAQFIARRASSLLDKPAALQQITQAMRQTSDQVTAGLLAGALEGLAGRRKVAMPDSWSTTFDQLQRRDDETIRERSMQLALVFDDPRALVALREQALDMSASAALRNRAISSLVAKQADGVAPLLLKLISDPITRRAAIRGLAEFQHDETVSVLLSAYDSFDPASKQDAVQTLAARVDWALQLMQAVESNRLSRSDVTAYAARQMQSLNNPQLTTRVKAVWGELRSTPAEKQKLIDSYKKQLVPDALVRMDRRVGRAVFQKTCANCHKFFDAGGAIGPNITGSQRTNLDYLLHTLIDPSAAVAKDFQMHIIETSSGRVITGLIVAEAPAAITVQTVNEKVVVPKSEIESRTPSPLSMMPEGMLSTLSTDHVRALFAYLMGPEQVPLPPESESSAGS